MPKQPNAYRSKDGFTLIELVIVLTILGILAAIAIPSLIGYIERAQIAADQTALHMLNTATTSYGLLENKSGGDIFTGIATNPLRMAVLVDYKFLDAMLTPQHKNAEFVWHIESQKWLYRIVAGTAENPIVYYDFADLSKDQFLFSKWGGGGGSTWSINADGLNSTGTNGSDLLFIANNKEEYTLKANFQLGENSTESGGVGLFFETSLDTANNNRDTGYVLQFDKGYSEIVIRKRVSGSESESLGAEILARIGNRSTSTIKNTSIPYHTDSAWWTAEKELSLSVENSDSAGKKLLTLTLDGEVLLTNFEIDSAIDPANNNTGFRAWNGAPVKIADLTVQ